MRIPACIWLCPEDSDWNGWSRTGTRRSTRRWRSCGAAALPRGTLPGGRTFKVSNDPAFERRRWSGRGRPLPVKKSIATMSDRASLGVSHAVGPRSFGRYWSGPQTAKAILKKTARAKQTLKTVMLESHTPPALGRSRRCGNSCRRTAIYLYISITSYLARGLRLPDERGRCRARPAGLRRLAGSGVSTSAHKELIEQVLAAAILAEQSLRGDLATSWTSLPSTDAGVDQFELSRARAQRTQETGLLLLCDTSSRRSTTPHGGRGAVL